MYNSVRDYNSIHGSRNSPNRQAPHKVAVAARFATCVTHVVNIVSTATFRVVMSIWVFFSFLPCIFIGEKVSIFFIERTNFYYRYLPLKPIKEVGTCNLAPTCTIRRTRYVSLLSGITEILRETKTLSLRVAFVVRTQKKVPSVTNSVTFIAKFRLEMWVVTVTGHFSVILP